LSGNPVRPVVSVDPGEARTRFGVDPGARVILVVGGSQGSRAINAAVTQVVRGLTKGELTRPESVILLWATGPEHYGRIHQELDALGSPPWVRILPYIQDMPGALAASDLAVSRAGAMTTAELLAWGVPAVLVPLPSAAADHQTRNAESLVEAGTALHLPERDLSGPVLWRALEPLLTDPGTLAAMRASALAASRPQATTEIAEALAELLPSADREFEGGAP
jgi:UDP-N-acetylglucosamine--N-acetylmuramyl-(pentapeptide) pyrophosphoryl-undecaprenol N-acetylglucosamine transferase